MAIISKLSLFLAILSSFIDRSSVVAEDAFWDPYAHLPTDLVRKPRIVNGDRSNPSNRSFFAKAGHDNNYATDDILCGATVIWSDILITAAHCQGAFDNGAFILDPNSNDYTRSVQIDRQIRHPEWSISRKQLNYDVLILRLATPLSSIDVVKPIPINSDKYYPHYKQSLKAYGFGLTENKVVSNHLREADVTYISNDECWGRGINFNNVMKSDEVMCTDPFLDRTATCLGDSGGPLTDSSGSFLVGVISFGSGCEADQIPDGHVRLSEVNDWVEEQICLTSASPPDNCSLTTKPRDPRAIEVVIDFTHDFFPEQTTFAVQSKETFRTVYAGPEYIPTRNGKHKESIFLQPGEYTFDVYDIVGDGLVSPGGNGHWKISALYDGCTETEVALGGPFFKNQQVTKFVLSEDMISYNSKCSGNPDTHDIAPNKDEEISKVIDVAAEKLENCLENMRVELSTDDMSAVSCTCAEISTSDNIELTCAFENGSLCAQKYQFCAVSGDCCGKRNCVGNRCRSRTQKTDRESNRIGETSVGGAAARSARHPGNLRRR